MKIVGNNIITTAIRIDNFDQIEECLKLSSWNDSGDYVIARR